MQIARDIFAGSVIAFLCVAFVGSVIMPFALALLFKFS